MGPQKPSSQNSKEKILIVHTAFIGDIVLATPFLAAVRQQYPQADIAFLTTPAGAELVEPNPWNVKLILFQKRGLDSGPGGFLRKLKEVRQFNPTLVFCLHRSIRSVLLARLAGGESWGFREAAGSFLLGNTVSRLGYSFEAEKNLALLSGQSGVKNFSPFPKLYVSPKDQESTATMLGSEKYVVLAPSSVWATKKWPSENFAELSEKIWEKFSLRTVLVGGNSEADRLAAEGATGKLGNPLNLAGKTSLGQLKSILSRATLVVSNDSSPLHMAIGLGVRVVGIYGPTTKELGFFPLAEAGKSAVAELKGLPCRPCGKHGHDVCPLVHFRCMRELSVDAVFAEVSKLLCQ